MISPGMDVNGILYLRCIYGGESAIIEFDINTLKYKKMPLEFYRNGVYDTAGICSFITEYKNKDSVFVALYEQNNKMYLCVGGEDYDLFDEDYSILVERKIFSNTVTLMYCLDAKKRLNYKTMAGVDDVFSYVEDVLSDTPRRIVRRKSNQSKGQPEPPPV